MSRGGRGAFRGGGGGGGGGRIGGVEVPWAVDPDIKPDFKPSELFPVVEQPKPTPLSRIERLQVARYRAFRDRVHEGPLYTILGDGHRVGKQGGSSSGGAALVDPFEGMPTYSQKYRKKTRRLPRLDTRPYVMDFFPKELWSTLDPDYEKQNEHDTATARNKKKILKLSRPDVDKDLLNEDDDEFRGVDDAEGQTSTKEALKVVGDEDEDEQEKPAEDELGEGEEEDEEEQDDDFEDAEDEMGEDYNAEGYFEDGRDDDMDDYGDGGGDDEAGYM